MTASLLAAGFADQVDKGRVVDARARESGRAATVVMPEKEAAASAAEAHGLPVFVAGLAEGRRACRRGRDTGSRRAPSIVSETPSGRPSAGAEIGDPPVADQQRCRPASRPVAWVDQPDVGDDSRVHGRLRLARHSAATGARARPAPPSARTTPISTCSPDHRQGRVVGDGAVDLDAAVHRARVHDEHVLAPLWTGELGAVEAEEAEILPRARHQAAGFMRSRWRRSIMTTSAPARPLLHVVEHGRRPAGRRRRPGSASADPSTRTRLPMVVSRWMLDRATRLCSTSPQMATDQVFEAAAAAAHA